MGEIATFWLFASPEVVWVMSWILNLAAGSVVRVPLSTRRMSAESGRGPPPIPPITLA